MTEFDPDEFGRSVGETILKVTDPLSKRVADLEKRSPQSQMSNSQLAARVSALIGKSIEVES